MEVTLRQKIHFSLTLFRPSTTNFLSFPHCCCFKSWIKSKKSFKKHLTDLAENCRFHVQEMSKPKGQGSNNHCLVHVVKDGETVESISKQYGVSIDSIAAANKLDMNILFKGQLLNIPAFGMEDPQLTKKRESFIFYKQERSQDGFLNRKAFTMLLTSHGLSHACLLNNRTKSTGYFLFLVLVIAFCIKCIIGVFHSGDPRDTELQTSDESRKNHRDQPRSMRWKSALIDVEGPNLDSDLRPDSNNASEDQDSNFFEDMSHAYSKLEIDYQKFLSECGISNQ